MEYCPILQYLPSRYELALSIPNVGEEKGTWLGWSKDNPLLSKFHAGLPEVMPILSKHSFTGPHCPRPAAAPSEHKGSMTRPVLQYLILPERNGCFPKPDWNLGLHRASAKGLGRHKHKSQKPHREGLNITTTEGIFVDFLVLLEYLWVRSRCWSSENSTFKRITNQNKLRLGIFVQIPNTFHFKYN